MRPLILVTNDDGIDSVGLVAAAEAMLPLGEVLVAAPLRRQTAMGRSFPRFEEQGVIATHPLHLSGETAGCYSVCGSPAQTVAHAILELAPRRPALCLCGVNDGENLGNTCLVSGTIGAALEATAFGIPAVAISTGPEAPQLFRGTYRHGDWEFVGGIIRRIARRVVENGLPAGVDLLNVNIPLGASPDTEIRITRQSDQPHYMCEYPGVRDFAKPLRLPVGDRVAFDRLEPDSDMHAFLVDRAITVTPMAANLTATLADEDCSGRLLAGLW